MTIITWTIAKGIAPKPHKSKAKSQKATTKRRHKQISSESESSEEEASSSDDKPKAKKEKRKTKHQRKEKSEAELIEGDVDPPNKDVENVDDAEEGPEKHKVSSHHLVLSLERYTHHNLGWQPEWPSTWCRPWSNNCEEGFNSWPTHEHVRQVTVKFQIKPDEYEMEIGRWCNLCK